MIHVFFNKRGTGKTKAMINLANEMVAQNKGDMVYIDDDKRPLFELDRRIRFISTDEFNLKHIESFYGFLCGILSENYDINTIFIDGLFNIVDENVQNAAQLFYYMEKMVKDYNVTFYININAEQEIPEYMRKYVA
ncbi:hypothetical protein [Clostridium sp. JN-9]|uniref:hypothetical protein n=1 Tax=Clostridium sp. JN-9 TaxID=2507159 RepID=UPI000FFE15CC|nr:hypothetical protein [Clostridium sp. JN-9]QAT39272.1 hypothetical protein EQM05_02835 [Clostridium sp. JN-9]